MSKSIKNVKLVTGKKPNSTTVTLDKNKATTKKVIKPLVKIVPVDLMTSWQKDLFKLTQ